MSVYVGSCAEASPDVSRPGSHFADISAAKYLGAIGYRPQGEGRTQDDIPSLPGV